VATPSVERYRSSVGTINLGLAIHPTTSDVFVANTEARNLTRFEPNLRGHVVENWVTRLSVIDGSADNVDLIAKGTLNGERRGLVYDPLVGAYRTDKSGLGRFTGTDLAARLAAGDVFSFMGVPPGSGARMGIDCDLDGRLDGD
jgi:hypothetical protein